MSRHKKILSILDTVAKNVEPIAAARIAAALVYKNSIISIGFNRRKSHPFQSKFSAHDSQIFLHAENDALVKSLRLLTLDQMAKSSLYVCRLKYNDSEMNPSAHKLHRGLAKPCEGCMRGIASLNIKRVCYTTDNGVDWL